MVTNENVIGENIKRYRKKSNYSQKQLAKALGISPATLSSYETGKTIPDSKFIFQLSLKLELPTDLILDIKENEEEATYTTLQKQQDL